MQDCIYWYCSPGLYIYLCYNMYVLGFFGAVHSLTGIFKDQEHFTHWFQLHLFWYCLLGFYN
jgi:hypothetical protein